MVLEPLREQAVALEPLLEEVRTTQESHVGANAEQWEEPLRHEAATMVLELLREETTMIASSRHVLGRPLWKEATMTAPADCESELSRSVK